MPSLSLSLSPLYSIICLPYSGQHPAHTAGIVISIRNRSATKSKFRCWEPTRLEQNRMCFSKACHLLCMLIVLPHPGWTLAFFFFWCVCLFYISLPSIKSPLKIGFNHPRGTVTWPSHDGVLDSNFSFEFFILWMKLCSNFSFTHSWVIGELVIERSNPLWK